ncbi:MAG TPA: MarR family transcriptional regulator [Paracoccaceae bacterium]|nr:MarR family transcriptional regulator [Paracoccaceae bacterium]HMO73471.1 MarR family transcriptional regulator [Paracoccaceae bacterium]
MPDSPPPPGPWFALFTEIGILGQLSRAMLEARLPPGFLQPHFSVLNHLIRVRDGQTPLALARAFQVPKTTMTHTLAGLERGGLVRMAPNPRDGRSKRVWITDAGRAFREEAIAALSPDLAALTARFPSDRVAAVLPVMAELRAVMDAMRDEDPDDPAQPPPPLVR